MPKHHIVFKLPEENSELKLAMNAAQMSIAIEEISNEVFRPARKHGYWQEDIKTLLETIDKKTDGKGTELISLLEEKFYNILNENDVNRL